MKRTLGHRPLVHDAGRLKTFLGTTPGGSGSGPADATYLTLSLHADLSAERRLIGGDGLAANDGGANGDFTLSVDLAGTSGLELTGVSPNKDLQLADTVAGDGLTIASKILTVNAGTGLAISGDAVILAWSGVPGAIQPDASAAGGSSNYAARTDHTHAIVCAAPGASISVSSTNTEGTSTSFARADHLHAATTSSNPSAASILASDANGKLQLKGLGIGVSATVAAAEIQETSLDHLRFTRGVALEYVGWNLSSDALLLTDIHNESKDVYWRVYNESMDPQTSYRVHIGLNCDGDAQFDLDVGGNVRVQGWIVGKHAIQLSGALMICHYDGPEPFETNYAGTCVGHKGQVATTGGGVIFRPGKFQKGVQIAEATTNLHTNPSAETNTTGWSITNGALSQSTTYSRFGTNSFKCVFDGVADGYFYDTTEPKTNPAQDESYTVSFWVYAKGNVVGKTLTVTCREKGGATGTEQTKENYTLVAGWQRAWSTHTVLRTDRTAADAHTGLLSPEADDTLYFDGCQFEEKAYVTPYCDGSLGLIADGAWRDGEPGTEGHYWNGTAHASTSDRVVATLKYATSGNVNASEGTIGGWVYIDSYNPAGCFLWGAGNVGNELDGYYNASGTLYFRVNGQVLAHHTTATLGAWHLVVCTWSSVDNEMEVYLDGVASTNSNTPTTTPPTLHTYIGVGHLPPEGTAYLVNGTMDEFFITDNAMDVDEIRAIYESEAPVFAESSTFQFSAGPSQLIWADHEGLWARDTAGEAALGLFCGTGTKSWGGFTMGPADLVLGANVSGSAAIHWDQSTGKFGFYGNANATVQVEIGTDGSLTAGAGVVMLDADGIDIESTTDYADLHAYTFSISGTTVSSLSAKYGATYNYIKLEAEEIADRSSHINIFSYGPNGKDSSVWLIAQADHSASVLFQSDESAGYSAIYWTTDKARLRLGDTAGAYTFSIEDSATAEVFNIDSDGDVRIGGGLYVGSVATDPAADDIWCDGYISTNGGTTKWGLGGYTGGTSTPTGYIVVNVAGTSYQLSARPS